MIDNLKEEWRNSFEEAIKSIDNLMKSKTMDGEDTSNFRILARWLLTNEHSSYDYMDSQWVGFKYNPYSTEQVLNNLHHAMTDDGDVRFVNLKINGELKRIFMTFDYPYDESFNLRCIQENQILIDSMINASGSAFEIFTKLKEAYPEKELKIPNKITMEDIEFETHNDSNRFIKELEDFQEMTKVKRQETQLRLKTLTR